MSNTIIGLKSIEGIIKGGKTKPFFVDTYQRGYKWDKQQVEDLLNDIYNFDTDKDGDFYCLQPVVVKNKDKIEVIDGQQRMTTIFIILSFLRKEKFLIDYSTREASGKFLNDYISENKIVQDSWADFVKINKELNNIDNYHFFIAFKTVFDFFSTDKNKEHFYNNLTKFAKVIWYEVNEDIKSQELFARINIGKIPLTNSELIKALFLSSRKNVDLIKNQIEVKWDSESSQVRISGFDKINIQNNELKTQIALEWDFIEKELQNDEFWYFLSDEKENKFTRIDLLLDIIANKDFENKKQDTLFSFYEFSKKDNLSEEWFKVVELFYTLQDWYNDLEMYHLIGYLIAVSGKNKLKTIYKNQKTKTKLAFKDSLKKEIQNSNTIQSFGNYGYGDGLVKNVLLLFNIKTHIKTSTKNNFNRFPFKSYKINKWSIEHIHAQNSENLKTQVQWSKWLDDAINELGKIKNNVEISNLISEIKDCNKDNLENDTFQELFEKVMKITSDINEKNEMHAIQNLTLLDSSTNSSISNGLFVSKREMILNAEKGNVFIPICTKNVFLKYYSKDPKQFYFWSKEDRKAYFEAMEEMLEITVKK